MAYTGDALISLDLHVISSAKKNEGKYVTKAIDLKKRF